jgi:hypothetical protein
LPTALLLLPAAAFSEDAKDAGAGRFYAGIGAATLTYEGEHDDVVFDDGSFGLEAYGGFKLGDNLSLEVSLRSDDVVDLNDIAGSGTTRLDIDSSWDTATVKAVGDLSLQELLSWRRDWRLFGALGYYRSDIDRTVVTLGTGAGETVPDDEAGLMLGTGVLYKIGFVDLRGYVEWYGVFDDREAWNAGVAVQMSF